MFTLDFNSNSFVVNEFMYDPLSDTIRFQYSTENPNDFKDELYSDGAIEELTCDDINTFVGYTRITRFYANYDEGNDIWDCYVTLEKDQTLYQKLVDRITQLEESKAEIDVIKDEVSALQKVNITALMEKDLISNDKATEIVDELGSVDSGKVGSLKGDKS